MLFRVKIGEQPQVDEGSFRLGKCQAAAGRVNRINRHNFDVLMSAERVERDLYHSVFVGKQVEEYTGRGGQEIEIGKVLCLSSWFAGRRGFAFGR